VSASAEPTQEDDRCPICGRLWTKAEQATWLFLEATRYTADGRPGWTSESFCSRAHAAEWLAQPLPPLEPVTFIPRTARDRMGDLGLVALIAVPAVLAFIGLVAIGNWVGLYG